MIKIKEISPPQKLSGRSSLLVKFDYNENIVNTIKTFSPAVFNKKALTWEISITHLSKLLDALTFYDTIKLTLLKDEITEISDNDALTQEEISEFKYTPFKHQIEAINYGLAKNKWLNLSTMGLGKTYEAICLAETLKRRGLIEHCLIICGVDSLRTNWKTELQTFSKESAIVLGERINRNGKVVYNSLPQRAEQLKNKIDEFFIVVNITNVGDDAFVEAFKKSVNKIDMIVFDEAHRATKHSQRGNNLLKLDAKYKIAMTGSLLVNSPLSAYLPLAWTDNDHATLTNFKSQYCELGGFNQAQIISYKNLDLLKEELDYCGLRRTFAQVKGDMPPKIISYELIEMGDAQQKFYDAIKQGVKEEADKIELNSNNLLALMVRLRQATSACSVLTSNPPESCKIERAVELVEDLIDQNEKVVIMSTFKEPVYDLATKLEKFQPLVCTGDQSEDIVSRNISNFRNLDNFNLLIGTMGKIGTGFSFPECHYMIFIDQPYTHALFSQCCDRIYRITSNQSVYIKVLVAAGTVDERIKEIVENKKELSDYLLDNVNNSLTNEFRSIISNL